MIRRIKRVQFVKRAVPGYARLHPAINPEFFDDRKWEAQKRLTKQLTAQGWREIHFELKNPSGIMVVNGQCLRDPVVLEGAKAGLYDLFAVPPAPG
jgi:hypothetical protein